MRRLVLALALLVAAASGPARADFIDIITGARPAGMGGAYVALADDVNAIYYNPAGLTLFKGMQLGFMHSEDNDPTAGPPVNTDFFGYTTGNSAYGAGGIAYHNHSLSDILQEKTLFLSYAYAMNPFTRLGLTMKSMAQTTNPTGRFFPDPALTNGSTMGFDVGLVHVVTPDLRFGFTARNLGAKLGTVLREEVRRTYRLGTAFRCHTEFIDEDYIWLTLDLFTKDDIDDESGMQIQNAIGLEWQATPWIALRAGADRGRFTAGAGICALGLSVDYAFQVEPEDGVGDAHRVSLTYRFGVDAPRERPPPPPVARPAPRPRAPAERPPPPRRRAPEG